MTGVSFSFPASRLLPSLKKVKPVEAGAGGEVYRGPEEVLGLFEELLLPYPFGVNCLAACECEYFAGNLDEVYDNLLTRAANGIPAA